MSDLISRQAAIDALQKEINKGIPPFDDVMGSIRCGVRLARNIIEDLPSAQPHWIPCSDRLPNSNGCYLVWRPHFWGGEIGMPAICYFDGQNTWHDSYGVDFERTLHTDDVTAWMPLPDPYKGEQE